LDIIDSDEAEVLNDPADLATKFTGGTFDRSKIARISVKLGDVTIQTIDPDQLTTDAQGDLTYDGSIANLIVGRTANNLVSFNIDFNDGTPTTSLNYRITSGQEEIRTQSADDTRKVITFSVNQTDFTESGSTESAGTSREINGNELANTVTVNSGKNTLQGDRGDDLFILNGGTNIVDGGEGIDTVKLNSTQATIGAITKNGNTIKIGTNITLQNVEFIELNDVRLSTDTQTVIPIISLQNRVISISEGDEGNTLATFVVNLSSPSTQDTVIDYATRSGNAVAGRDFTANIGKLTIAAGQATGTINIGILGNNQAVGDKQLFLDLSTSSGAIFSNSKTKDSARVNIQDDDTAIGISLTADRTDFVEGSPDQPASVVLTVDRFGNLDGIDVIGYQIIPTGNKPVAANDFVSGLTSGQITFASGEYSKTLEIPISPDLEIEGDESFELKLISLTGSAVVPLQNLQFTILDNGVIISNLGRLINGTTGQDTLNGTLGNDTLNGGAGNDYLNGGLGNDYVVGGADNDVLDGSGDSAGLDTFIGGAGDDVYGIYNSNAVTIEEASGGIDTVWTAVDYTLTANVENMFLVGNLTGAGNASSNSISGYGMGSNNIYGLQGNDSLYGEEGNDYLNGGTENDYLDGGMGNDILDGSGDITGLDTFAGGANDDTYGVYNSSTVIIENADEGADTIWTAVNYTLSANVENMYVLGDLIGIGNSSNNLIIGYGMGNNTIYGLAGNDTLYGGEGNDHLNGGNDNDYLDGGNGNDILDGSGDTIGLDTFAGGANDDTYGIYNSSTVIIESADEGIDTVWTAVNYTLSANVENMYVLGDLVGIGNSSNNLIIGYGMGNNTIYGLAGNDTFYGGEGNDYLNGGTDNDYLDGGNGNDILDGSGDTIGLDTFAGGANDDTYGIYNSSTITIENADEGTDTVWTAVNHTLSVNIENMYLVGNVSGRGNSSNNIIYGYGIGDNIIDGGEGIDTLFGGTGNDTFILNKTSLDIIEDFGLGNDKLQVSASAFGGGLVANTALSANQLLVGANAIANNANQRFIYNTTNGELLFDIDGSGSSAAINIGRLSTKPTLETTSFIII
jgi:Ca2+-binding RTX toxin-like protein